MNETAPDDSPAFARGKGRRGNFRQFVPARTFVRKETKKERGALFLKQHQNDAVDNACKRAEDDDRPCDDEHFCRHAGDEALWLCQDRHTVFSEFFQLPPKWGALIVLACRYKFKPARSTHIYLNLS